jgi:hypothetical protein
MKALFLFATALSFFISSNAGSVNKTGDVCTVTPAGNGSDDSAAIIEAFTECKADSKIVFPSMNFSIQRVMTTVGLQNVQVDMSGYLLVSIFWTAIVFVSDKSLSGTQIFRIGSTTHCPSDIKTNRQHGSLAGVM